jgi:hypothetical protein
MIHSLRVTTEIALPDHIARMPDWRAMRSGSALKIALFGANHCYGFYATKVAQRRQATSPDCMRPAQMADTTGRAGDSDIVRQLSQ